MESIFKHLKNKTVTQSQEVCARIRLSQHMENKNSRRV